MCVCIYTRIKIPPCFSYPKLKILFGVTDTLKWDSARSRRELRSIQANFVDSTESVEKIREKNGGKGELTKEMRESHLDVTLRRASRQFEGKSSKLGQGLLITV